MKGPKVSVIIPVYNVKDYLQDCLDCVVNQTLKDIEIICVDDGSTDGSLGILREYEKRDPRVHVLTQKNQFAGVARNHGMEIATGEYYIFWDSDDLFELNALDEMYRHAKEMEADICLCGADRFDTTSLKKERMTWVLKQKEIPQEPFCARDVNSIFQVTVPAPWSKMFSAAFIRMHDLHFQNTVRINDMYFVFSALALAERIVYVDKPFVHYRIGQATNLQSKISKTPDICCQVHRALYARLKDEPIWNSVKMSFYHCVIENLAYNLRLVEGNPESKQQLFETIEDGYFDDIGFTYDDISALKNQKDYYKLYGELLAWKAAKPDIPAVSVVIPFHNNCRFVNRCLDSVLTQTLREIEIVCVDDGSTDGTPELLSAYEARDARVKLIAKEENGGTLLARKTGALAATGRYIMFLDSDDYLDPDACRTMVEEIKARGTDILQIKIGVEDYANDPEAKAWLENYLTPDTIRCNRSELQTHFYLKRDIATSLVGKIYYAPKCKLAYYNMPDIFCIIGEDIFQQFYFTYFSDSYCGVSTKPLYWYRRGLGDSDSAVMSAEKFKKYCHMAVLYRNLQAFVESNNADSISRRAATAAARRMCEDCCKIWHTRISGEEKMEAFKTLLNSWTCFPEFKGILEKTTGLSFAKLTDIWYPFPVFAREGSCYSDEKRPKVSIIIPVYNVEDYLAECIESVINQSFRDLELICINDGSTDNSLAILEEYAAIDDRITVISQKNQGLSGARNTGLEYVRGEFVEFLDSDDMLDEQSIETLYSYASAENLDVVFFGAKTVYEYDRLKASFSNYDSYYDSTVRYSVSSGQQLFYRLRHDHVYRESACLQFLRTAFLKDNGLRFYPGIIHEDNLFTFMVCMLAKRAAKLDNNFYIRRVRDESIMTLSPGFKSLFGYLKSYAQMRAFIETHELEPQCENDIEYYVNQIRSRVSDLAGSLPAGEMKKKAQLHKADMRLLDEIIEQKKHQNEIDAQKRKTVQAEKQAAIAEEHLNNVHHSVSFRVGRVITFIPRKVRGGVRCYHEHGMRYTWNRFLVHLRLKKE